MTPTRRWRRSPPGSRTPWTWTRSRPTWSVSCSTPWSPPTSQCGSGHESEPGFRSAPPPSRQPGEHQHRGEARPPDSRCRPRIRRTRRDRPRTRRRRSGSTGRWPCRSRELRTIDHQRQGDALAAPQAGPARAHARDQGCRGSSTSSMSRFRRRPSTGRAERGVAQNIRIWSVTLIEPRFAEAVQIRRLGARLVAPCCVVPGGRGPMGVPISQWCPNGSVMRPSRQPCSSPTGGVTVAPAAKGGAEHVVRVAGDQQGAARAAVDRRRAEPALSGSALATQKQASPTANCATVSSPSPTW